MTLFLRIGFMRSRINYDTLGLARSSGTTLAQMFGNTYYQQGVRSRYLVYVQMSGGCHYLIVFDVDG
jgi:hypothetical protein